MAAGATLLAWAAWHLGTFDSWERTFWDFMSRGHLPHEAISDSIRVVTIGADDVAAIDSGWPPRRDSYCDLLHFLKAADVKSVTFTVEFCDAACQGAAVDSSFAVALAAMPIAVLPAAPVWDPALASGSFADRGIPAVGAQVAALSAAAGFRAPIDELLQATTALGANQVSPDGDRLIRSFTPLVATGNVVVPSLGIAALCVASPAQLSANGRVLRIGQHDIPLDRDGQAILRSRTLPEDSSFRAIDLMAAGHDLIVGRPPRISTASFSGCHVFVGFSLEQGIATPSQAMMPAPAFWALAMDNVVTDALVREISLPAFLLGVAPLAFLAALAAQRGRNPWIDALAVALLGACPFGCGWIAYAKSMWIPVVAMSSSPLAGGIAAFVMRYAWEARRRAFVDGALSMYVPPAVVATMIDNPELLNLNGVDREITVLFADLVGFTAISERVSPAQVTTFLNKYLRDAGALILKRNGTIDKFIGDAVVAFWNAPLDTPNHADEATACAREICTLFKERASEYAESIGVVPRVRIGIATGHATVGNLGSADRLAYSAIGDAVNLASRLEGANKAFGSTILISERTWRQLRDEPPGQSLAIITVAGRDAPEPVYEIHDPTAHDQPDPGAFERARELARAGDFEGARDAFRRLSGPTAAKFCLRCDSLARRPGQAFEPWPISKGQ